MSPTFLERSGYRIFTWSKEEERIHVHVIREQKQCKFWLEPTVELAENRGFKKHELNEIEKIVKQNEKDFKERWRKHFG
jgi:CRISPR/Cas system-associated endonuclease Cas1